MSESLKKENRLTSMLFGLGTASFLTQILKRKIVTATILFENSCYSIGRRHLLDGFPLLVFSSCKDDFFSQGVQSNSSGSFFLQQ